ncbi:hypothetical protein NDA14_000491 [Ustilago hordei]|nr:hypothetical protein NDA10_003201 [Ustilago hordei]KAJ1578011.1 hypothetical protein NDA12_001527 [Ustilago hordei]KAJ1592382.1 hypothetical protein NDA15_001243 [Ustilago hordei]KAJ1595711.1 hypothetical protein NDA14_000491 [Ustilago hordei]UTT89979.1 hypothetical protein NDA17_004240 [Ustilago hordei]
MPLLMSRKSPESEASTSFRARSSGSSSHHRSERPSSQKAAELRARYEMAQAIQKPWPLHLLENGVKPAAASSSPPPSTSTAAATSSSRSTRSSSANKSSTRSSSANKSSTRSSSANKSSTRSSSSTRRETRSGAAAAVASTHAELAAMDADARSSKKKRNSANSLDKLSLSPTLSNWIKRASKDSDKSTSSTSSSGRSSSPPSSLATSPLSSPKDL